MPPAHTREELTRALAALGENATLQHPMLTGVESPQRSGILLITSDRGLAGGYNANAIKRANQLARRLRGEGKEVVWYVIGRKGAGVFQLPPYRGGRQLDRISPSSRTSSMRAKRRRQWCMRLIATSDGTANDEPGMDELFVVYTKFVNSVSQTAHGRPGITGARCQRRRRRRRARHQVRS